MRRAWKELPGVRPLYLPAALCLLLVGCQGGQGRFVHDPLFGGPPVSEPFPGSRSPAGNASASAATGEVPPVPPAHTPTSQAALASATAPGGSSGNGARLGGPQPAPGVAEGGRLKPVAPAGSNGVTLTSGSGTPGELTYEQVHAMLLARGVTMQKLETVGDRGEWQFSCAVPNKKIPNLRRNYEARAVGANGLAAMRAVLEKIDQEQGAATNH